MKFIPSEYNDELYVEGQARYRQIMLDLDAQYDHDPDNLQRVIEVTPYDRRVIWEYYAVTYGAAALTDPDRDSTSFPTPFGTITLHVTYNRLVA